jgi:hypothetical protein
MSTEAQREKWRRQCRERYWRKIEQYRATKRAYRERHRERIREQMKQWRAANWLRIKISRINHKRGSAA